MKGLIYKDLYNLAKNLGLMAVMMVVMSVFFMENGSAFLASYLIIMGSMMVVTTMSYDDLAKWDNFALTLPLSRRDMVLGKYGTMLAMNLLAALCAVLISAVMGTATGTLALLEILLTTAVSLAIGLIYGAITLPAIYKFGTEKARLILILLTMSPTFLLITVFKYLPDGTVSAMADRLSTLSPLLLGGGAVILVAVVLLASLQLSIKIYEKKEF